jgi:hypothetical protein
MGSVERECYTLGSFEGQTEKALGVGRGGPSKVEGIVGPGSRDLRERVSDPRRLVPFPSEGNGCEIWGIGLHEQAIPRHQSQQVVVRPFLEGHDPAERDVPARLERELGQRTGARIAVQDAEDARGSSIANHRACVVFRVSGVDDYGLVHLIGERNLGRECRALHLARRIVVMIVESALADRDGRFREDLAQLRHVARGVKRGCVVRMYSRGRKDEAWVVRRALGGDRRRRERFPDADDRQRARLAGARDYRVAVAGEGRVREVGVAVDEDGRVLVLRGHLRSIQRSTGAAT